MTKTAELSPPDTCAIYVIAHLKNGAACGPCKVGISEAPGGRLSTLQTGNPAKLCFAATFLAPNRAMAADLERAFHLVMAAHRLEGEWFDLHPLRAVHAMCRNISACLAATFEDDPETRDLALDLSGVTDALEVIRQQAPTLLDGGGVVLQ